ncbi:MAG: murein biosynthesis integral membrane protein MurJ [Dehalococcoidia bacterium]
MGVRPGMLSDTDATIEMPIVSEFESEDGDSASRGARALALASLLVAATYFGSRVLGALRTTAVGGAFGTPPELDAYYVGNRIPDIIFQLIAGATLASAFIPTFAWVRRQRGEQAGWRLASSVLNLVFLLTLTLAVLTFLLAPWLVPLTAPGLGDNAGRGPEMQQLAVKLTRLMLIAPVIFSVSGMISGVLNARHRFLLSGLAPMLYNAAIILGAIAYGTVFRHHSREYGVTLLAGFTVAGAAGHLLVQLPGLARVGMRYYANFDLRDPAVREVVRLMLPRMLGLAAVQANFLVTTYFASQMSAGTISSLTFAWSLVVLPLALIGQAISTAVFPHMAEQAAGDDHYELQRTLSQAVRVIIFLTIPATVGLAVLRIPVVSLVLQHGAFSANATRITAEALLFYSLGLAAQALIEILSRGFYALRDTRTPVLFAVLSMVLNLVLSLLLRGPMGYRGLALALSLAVSVEAVLLIAVLRTRLHGLNEGAIAWSAVRGAAAALAMAVAVAAFMVWARHYGPLVDRRGVRYLVEVIGGIPIGAAAFFAVARIVGAEEMLLVESRLLQRLRRGAGAAA